MKIILTIEEAKNELARRFNEINESSGVRVTEAVVTIDHYIRYGSPLTNQR